MFYFYSTEGPILINKKCVGVYSGNSSENIPSKSSQLAKPHSHLLQLKYKRVSKVWVVTFKNIIAALRARRHRARAQL